MRQRLIEFRFLSTLSLRRATVAALTSDVSERISIHALLAESDSNNSLTPARILYFYPRSPCGERHLTVTGNRWFNIISIHALLAESDPGICVCMCTIWRIFLSTLSLRRATIRPAHGEAGHVYFYPRSPCGERPACQGPALRGVHISIHALLAESDPFLRSGRMTRQYFYPRSPCGERL